MRKILPTGREREVLILGDMFDKEEIKSEHSNSCKDGGSSPISGDVLKKLSDRQESLSNELAAFKLFVNEKFDYLFSTLNSVMEKVGIVRMDDFGDRVSFRFDFF